jgi:hypothetical protein
MLSNSGNVEHREELSKAPCFQMLENMDTSTKDVRWGMMRQGKER